MQIRGSWYTESSEVPYRLVPETSQSLISTHLPSMHSASCTALSHLLLFLFSTQRGISMELDMQNTACKYHRNINHSPFRTGHSLPSTSRSFMLYFISLQTAISPFTALSSRVRHKHTRRFANRKKRCVKCRETRDKCWTAYNDSSWCERPTIGGILSLSRTEKHHLCIAPPVASDSGVHEEAVVALVFVSAFSRSRGNILILYSIRRGVIKVKSNYVGPFNTKAVIPLQVHVRITLDDTHKM